MTRHVAIDLAAAFSGLAGPDQPGVYAPEAADEIEAFRATAEKMLRADPLNETLQKLYLVAARGKADVQAWPYRTTEKSLQDMLDDGRRRYFEWFSADRSAVVPGGAA